MMVVCTLVLMLPGNYREVIQAKGIDLDKDGQDTWLVDFTEDLKKRGYANKVSKTVYRVKDNDCLIIQK